MKKKDIQKTDFCSWRCGSLSKGCKACVQGRKSVLFITGICTNDCYYCPISDHKKNNDVIYINETPVKGFEDVEEEIRVCSSTGVGITGGDPLSQIQRTCMYICQLKKQFGKGFHIHLYTPLTLVNETNLAMLAVSGLDEIRFHPDIEDDKNWERIRLAKRFNWDIGIEIPVIPGKLAQTKKLINYVSDDIMFLNLNELEIADNSFSKLHELGFRPKDSISYAVSGSEEMAMKLLEYCQSKAFDVHYCTAKLKDSVQMQKRIRLRAKNVAKAYDIITKDGMLRRGAVYLSGAVPGKDYRKLISEPEHRKKLLSKLRSAQKNIAFKTEIDEMKCRLLCPEKNVKRFRNKIKEAGLIPAIVEEYPTYDGFEVEVDFL